MRLRGGGEVLCVRGILGSERVAGFPALVREDTMAEAGSIVGPGGVLGVVGDARAAGGERNPGRANPDALLHAEWNSMCTAALNAAL